MSVTTKGYDLAQAGLLVDNVNKRYSVDSAAYKLHMTLVNASSSLDDFLNNPHNQYVPGSNAANDISENLVNIVNAADKKVEKFQALSEYSDADIEEMAEVFIKNPVEAVTTLLNACRVESKWNPLSSNTKESAEGFSSYTKLVSSLNLFEVESAETESLSYSEKDYKDLINKAADAISGIFTGDITTIKNSLTSLAIACTSQSNTENTATTFCQSQVSCIGSEKDIHYSLAYTWMSMRYSVNSGKSAPANEYQQQTQIVGASFKFAVLKLTHAVAKNLARLQYGVCSLSEFAQSMKTPVMTGTKSCLV